MLDYEQRLWNDGIEFVAGVDEVGRGCLLGDVVAAAVIWPKHLAVEDIRDSKRLTERQREQWFEYIHNNALAVSIGSVDAATIDIINIKQAARLAMKRAVEQLPITPQYLLVDAERIECSIPQLAVVKGDATSQSIAAASIVAKVTRDRMCVHWDMQYPEYGIAKHKGYATSMHREAIRMHGPSPLHRSSFLGKIVGADSYSDGR